MPEPHSFLLYLITIRTHCLGLDSEAARKLIPNVAYIKLLTIYATDRKIGGALLDSARVILKI